MALVPCIRVRPVAILMALAFASMRFRLPIAIAKEVFARAVAFLLHLRVLASIATSIAFMLTFTLTVVPIIRFIRVTAII